MTNLQFESSALGAFSQRLSAAIFEAFPQFRADAAMIESGEKDGLSLKLIVQSPTGDQERTPQVWVDEKATPSIGFGPDHTHESEDDEGISAIVDMLQAMLADQLIILEEIDGNYPGSSRWIDLREPDALEEQFTSQYSGSRFRLKSWSGRADREIDIADL